jgi:Mg/Co/Ni transporter MgtE
LSPRAACRLATLGFTRVHDYAAGKAEWLANALPVEGTRASRPTAGSLARKDAATCPLSSSAAHALDAIDKSPYGFALVLGPAEVLLGRVHREALEAVAGSDPIEPIIEPGPSTVRPHRTVEELRDRLKGSDVSTLVITRADGTLIGVVRKDDVPE